LPVSLNSPLPTKILVHSFRDALLAQWPPALSVLSAAVGTVVAAPRGPACSSQIGNRGLTQRCTNAARGAEVVEGGVQKILTLTAQGNVTRHLATQCFNCFLPSHHAAQCQQRTRCFKCHVLGHRSFECRELLGGGVGSFKSSILRNQSTIVGHRPALPVKVWRPKVVAPAAPVFTMDFTSCSRPSSSVEEATVAEDVELGAGAKLGQEGLRSPTSKETGLYP
jgi:hypothetical protein